jgi:hypothetical protein
MGREVKRVALDFDWPLNKRWEGFMNPHYRACGACEGGSTTDALWLDSLVHLLMLAGSDGARGSFHPWLKELPLAHASGPTARFAGLTTGLAGRAPSMMGHDGIDRWVATKKILAAAGLPEDWGYCQVCKGAGIDPEVKEAYEAWTETEPPAGEGWQLWETISEGSPISPVFATPEGLAKWLSRSKSWGACETSYERWLAFLTGPGWAPSLVVENGEVMDGVEAATRHH